MLHLYELVLISHAIQISDSVPLPSGNCFVFRTPQRFGILFRNGIEDPSELLFCVFLPENIYQFQCLCVFRDGEQCLQLGTAHTEIPGF